MLTLEAVTLRQGSWELTAEWRVRAGERIALIGPSGAGKSSLLMAIAGFAPPGTGRILWNGEDLAAISPGDRPITILFQDQNLFPHLSVWQNLALGLSARLRPMPDQSERIELALHEVGLGGMGLRKPAQLSGGQQGRVALARAMLRARPILLLDEPFAALGPALKAEMLMVLDRVATATGAAVLMVTHDPSDAKRFAEKTVLVADGAAHPPVATAEMFANPPPALRAYLGPQA